MTTHCSAENFVATTIQGRYLKTTDSLKNASSELFQLPESSDILIGVASSDTILNKFISGKDNNIVYATGIYAGTEIGIPATSPGPGMLLVTGLNSQFQWVSFIDPTFSSEIETITDDEVVLSVPVQDIIPKTCYFIKAKIIAKEGDSDSPMMAGYDISAMFGSDNLKKLSQVGNVNKNVFEMKNLKGLDTNIYVDDNCIKITVIGNKNKVICWKCFYNVVSL